MKPDPRDLRRWLAAEADAPDEERGSKAAEEALLRFFRSVPTLAPSAGFAARVMARAGFPARRAAVGFWPLTGVWRWAALVALTLVGVSALIGPAVLLEGLGELSWSTPAELLADSVRALGEGFHRGFAFWELLARIGEACSRVVAQPAVMASLAVIVGIAALAFRLLLELTSRDRSWSHV